MEKEFVILVDGELRVKITNAKNEEEAKSYFLENFCTETPFLRIIKNETNIAVYDTERKK